VSEPVNAEVRVAARSVLERLEPLRATSELIVVGIDGHSGAGKSSLAKALAEAEAAVEVMHGDFFYKPESLRAWPPQGNEPAGHEFELDRLEREVLAPLAEGLGGTYAPRDFTNGTLLPRRQLPLHGVAVIEGIYVLTKQLRTYYDHTVWVDCPVELCLDRVLDRDGDTKRRDKFVDVWFPQESRYVHEHAPDRAADQIVRTVSELGRS
jgi:uridine kinase